MKIAFTKLCFVFLLFVIPCTQAFSQLTANFTSSAASGCEPWLVHFNDASTGGTVTSWAWDFGDGTNSIDTNPDHYFNLLPGGPYTVTLTVSDGTNTSTKSINAYVTVYKNPAAQYTVTSHVACAGAPITYTDASIPGNGPIVKWKWTSNDGSATDSTSGNTWTHGFISSTTPSEVFYPVLTVVDANGCNSIYSSDSIVVYQDAVASFSFIGSCLIPANINFVNTSTGPGIYTWDFGDPPSGVNNTSNQPNPSHIYNSAGSYLVKLTNGLPGCIDDDTLRIDLEQPIASYTTVSDTICPGDSVQFTNTSTPNSASYTWNFGDNPLQYTNKNPVHKYVNPGLYIVTLITSVGSCSSIKIGQIYVRPFPDTTFTPMNIVECSVPMVVNLFGDTTSQNVGWRWTFDDPGSGALDSASTRNPSHTYANFGDYKLQLIVTDLYGCRDTATDSIHIVEPQISFTLTDSGCVGKLFPFAASVNSVDPNIVNYHWNFGDNDSLDTPTDTTSHAYLNPGLYDVTLTITTQKGCTATLKNPGFILVGTPPAAEIDSVLHSICFKDNVQFNNLTPPIVTSWLWDFGDGGSSTEYKPNHQYNIDTSKTNPFDIILIARYNGCADTDTVFMMVEVKSPFPKFVPHYDCVKPDSVQFENTSGGGTSWAWDFGDASPTDVTFSPYHIYSDSGTYDVKLTATNSATGCVVDTTIKVHVTHLDGILQRDTNYICRPGTIYFTGSNSSDAISWRWFFGEGIPFVKDTSDWDDTLHFYSDFGNYTVKLMTEDIHQCKDTDTIVVHVIGPTADFTASPIAGCAPLIVNFTDNSTLNPAPIARWDWNYGDNTVGTTLVGNASHPYNFANLYTVSLTVTDTNGCQDIETKTSYLHPTSPIASINMSDTLGCRNVAEIINALAGPPGSFATPVTYTWNFGDGSTFSDTVNTVSHAYAINSYNNNSYHIQLNITDANGCTSSDTRNIFVYTTSANFHIDTTSSCVDENGIKKETIHAVFTPDSNQYMTNGFYYDWDLTVKQALGWTDPTYTHDYNVAPGSYDVSLTLTNDFGCKDVVLKPGAIVVNGPTGTFSYTPDSGCTPLTVAFTGLPDNPGIYAWDFDDGFTITGTSNLSPTHTYYTPGVYYPKFYMGFALSQDTCYILATLPNDSIEVTSGVDVNILEDVIYVEDGLTDTINTTVMNGTPPYQYNWDPINMITGGPNQWQASADQDSVYYTLSVPYGTPGCAGVDRVLVRFKPEICEVRWDSIPNVFTPNGDSKNDFFHIKDLCRFEPFFIKIYNRWGRLVYESTDRKFQWPGTTSGGTECSEGVYYYVMHAKTKDWHGWIELIRDEK